MLHVQQVTDSRLQAIIHVNGSASIQAVARPDNPMLPDLPAGFKRIGGVGVLCNTSLNFRGAGSSTGPAILTISREVGLDGFSAGIGYSDLT